ncbi:hypothetical protein BJX76DRAFT_188796 [Aspergillus varians]
MERNHVLVASGREDIRRTLSRRVVSSKPDRSENRVVGGRSYRLSQFRGRHRSGSALQLPFHAVWASRERPTISQDGLRTESPCSRWKEVTRAPSVLKGSRRGMQMPRTVRGEPVNPVLQCGELIGQSASAELCRELRWEGGAGRSLQILPPRAQMIGRRSRAPLAKIQRSQIFRRQAAPSSILLCGRSLLACNNCSIPRISAKKMSFHRLNLPRRFPHEGCHPPCKRGRSAVPLPALPVGPVTGRLSPLAAVEPATTLDHPRCPPTYQTPPLAHVPDSPKRAGCPFPPPPTEFSLYIY